jgi:hypothetical protein
VTNLCVNQCQHGGSPPCHPQHPEFPTGTATEATNGAMNQLLNYLAMYPNDGATYCTTDMILCAHADAGFHNESKGHSQASAHIFVSKKQPLPQAQRSGSLNLLDNEVCHVFCRRSRTWRSLHHSQGNGPPPSNPHHDGLAATTHTHPNGQLLLASITSPLSCKKISPWTSAYGGSAAKNLTNSSATTGIRAVKIGQTTTPSTTHQSTTKPTDPSMPVQQPNYLELLPHLGPAEFSY